MAPKVNLFTLLLLNGEVGLSFGADLPLRSSFFRVFRDFAPRPRRTNLTIKSLGENRFGGALD